MDGGSFVGGRILRHRGGDIGGGDEGQTYNTTALILPHNLLTGAHLCCGLSLQWKDSLTKYMAYISMCSKLYEYNE